MFVSLDQAIGWIPLIWRESLDGSAVILAFAAFGWHLGRARRAPLVRTVSWWLDLVVRPLFASRSWLRRAVIIFANNSLILAAAVLLGSLGHVAWAAVGCIGLGAGVALRLMI